MKLSAGITIALVCLASSVKAQSSGNDLIGACQTLVEAEAHANVEAYFDAGRCLGMMMALRSLGSVLVEDGRFCIPAGVTLKQMARTAVVGIKRRPEHMHQDFAHLAAFVFSDIWPCTTPRKK